MSFFSFVKIEPGKAKKFPMFCLAPNIGKQFFNRMPRNQTRIKRANRSQIRIDHQR